MLIGFAAGFAVLGVMLLTNVRGGATQRIQLRMKGVRQIRDYELGDALASAEQRKKASRQKRREVVRRKAFANIPALERRFGSRAWAEKLGSQLRQAQLPMTVTTFLLLCLGCGCVGGVATVIWFGRIHWLTPVAFVALAAPPYLYLGFAVATRIKKFGTQFPDALDLLSSSVKSGQALNSAIQNVAEEMPEPVSDEFRIIADELALGLDLSDALRRFQQRVPTQDVQFFGTALMIQKETGGNLSEILDGLQKTMRERFRILRQVRTLTAQGRLSGWVVGVLPIALGVIIFLINPAYMKQLLTPTGQKLLIVAGAFQFVGLLLIRKIVNIKV